MDEYIVYAKKTCKSEMCLNGELLTRDLTGIDYFLTRTGCNTSPFFEKENSK
jgi:hypothetical protein